jgi:hypothetical protein
MPTTKTPPKTVKAVRRRKPEPLKGPGAKATAATARDSWNAQIQDAAGAVKAQHGEAVDERALARATDGRRWAARATR